MVGMILSIHMAYHSCQSSGTASTDQCLNLGVRGCRQKWVEWSHSDVCDSGVNGNLENAKMRGE